MRQNKQAGMTLIELTVVLLVLVALAGLAIPYVSGTSRKALCDATDVSMANIKRVIMEGYYLDTLGNYPVSKSGGTIGSDYSLSYLFDQSGWAGFDLDSQVGWRGPYLQGGMTLNAADLQGNFKNLTYVNKKLDDGVQVAVLDGWGRPFVIQVVSNADCTDASKWNITTTEAYCARLVSAGFGSGVGVGKADLETTKEGRLVGDDRMLYLNVPTPAVDINPSCAD